MKVYIRSYRIPTVLIIMGGIMCIMASLEMTDKFYWPLFIWGSVCLFLGIIGWLGVQIGKSLKSVFKPRGGPSSAGKRR